MTHPTDDEIMELAGAWFHTGENQKRDDGYYYRSLGTPSNVRGSDLIEFARALLAEQARTEQAWAESELLTAIAQCRDAFPIPEHGDPLERAWAEAMADPLNVPNYVRAAIAPLLKAEQAKDAAEDAELLATVECLTDESGTEYVVVLRTKRPTLFGKGHKRESGAQKVADAINSEFGRAAMAQERKA